MSSTPPTPSLTGGCQCGAVRYRADAKPRHVHYCHCRMCQRAVGNVAATLVPVPKASVHWDGEPSRYRSSSVATRGFCSRCGTPLSFAYDASETICLTLGSLDDPAAVPPELHWGVESRVPWFDTADELPRKPTDESQLAGMTVHQHRPRG
jgi:hypothetical protein